MKIRLSMYDESFSVDQEAKKCQMKLTKQFMEDVLSKRSKRMRLSRASSVVQKTNHEKNRSQRNSVVFPLERICCRNDRS